MKCARCFNDAAFVVRGKKRNGATVGEHVCSRHRPDDSEVGTWRDTSWGRRTAYRITSIEPITTADAIR